MTEIIATAVAPPRDAAAAERSWSQGLRLRPDLRFCRFGPRFVFLDLAASRYFLLEGTAAERFHSFRDGTADPATLTWLQQRHILETGLSHAEVALPSPPTRSLFDVPPQRASLWLVVEAVCEQIAARRRVSREPLAALLRPGEAGKVDPEACRPVAAACRAAARYRSAADQCLPNALAMRAMLARRGISAELVIGAMLPFAAHCWLQSDDMVLSDPFGSVQNFHPLLSV